MLGVKMEKPVVFENQGQQIMGILHIPDKKEELPGVVLYHGFTGNKSESHFLFTKLSRLLEKKGICVLRFDFRGSGDSEGKFEDMTLKTEISDGKKAMEFLLSQKFIDKNKIGVLGLSMGAITASIIASEFKEVKYLCLWSPVAYPEIIRKKLLKGRLREKIVKKGKLYFKDIGHYLSKNFFKSLTEIDPLSFSKNFRGKVLIIHSKDDELLPISHSLSYFEAFHQKAISSQLLILKEGGHTFMTEFSENKVLEETTQFFSRG